MARAPTVWSADAVQPAAWLAIALGLTVVAAGFVAYAGTLALVNSVAVGVVVILMSAYAARAAARGRVGDAILPSAVAALVALWLVAFPFVAGVGGGYLWVSVAAGVLIAIFAASNAFAASRAQAAA